MGGARGFPRVSQREPAGFLRRDKENPKLENSHPAIRKYLPIGLDFFAEWRRQVVVDGPIPGRY